MLPSFKLDDDHLVFKPNIELESTEETAADEKKQENGPLDMQTL